MIRRTDFKLVFRIQVAPLYQGIGSSFTVGTEAAPFTHKAVITLHGQPKVGLGGCRSPRHPHAL